MVLDTIEVWDKNHTPSLYYIDITTHMYEKYHKQYIYDKLIIDILEYATEHTLKNSTSRDNLFLKITRRVCEITRSEFCAISIKKENDEFYTITDLDPLIDISTVFDHVGNIISNDILSDKRVNTQLSHPSHKIHTVLSIPLYTDDSVSAIINLYNKKKFSARNFVLMMLVRDVISKIIKCKMGMSSKSSIGTSEIDLTKDRFLATMSHELRTPLNGIVGMVTMLPDVGPLNSKQKEYISNLTECTFQLTNLLNNILDFSKMTANRLTLQKQPINIKNIIDDGVCMIEGKAKSKGIKINISIKKRNVKLVGDRQRLLQIISNLLSNAVKFTTSGSIDIRAEVKKYKMVNEYTKKYNLVVSIKDTGIGIPLDEQTKIFEVFHQSSNLPVYMSNNGTGLGLSIVKELVRMMDGTIQVYSSGIDGQGSTFTFNAILDEEIDITTVKSLNIIQDIKVLVVDDRPEMRLQLTDILLKWKCIPQTVSSAEEALRYINYGISYDILLVDLCMPQMSGIDLALEVRRTHPHLPMVGLSSIDVKNGEDYFDYYLTKPIDENLLFSAIVDILSKKKRRKDSLPHQRTKKDRRELKILVVEDNENNTYTIKEMLINLGYTLTNIDFVTNGKDCIAKNNSKIYDVILMDIVLPGMDGIEATRQIKQKKNAPMIIAVSAAVQPNDRTRGQRVGIDSYLSKPLTKDKLKIALSPLIL